MGKYYAYVVENERGILNSWDECLKKVRGKRSKYRKFPSAEIAQLWLDNNCQLKLPSGIYFDAGTGRGFTEARVTNELGDSLLKDSNENGNITLLGETNNYGELKALELALNIALDSEIMNIYGDSKLVIEYWSKGHIKRSLPDRSVKLAMRVKHLRDIFESKGGNIKHISGDLNPADLGFHK